ncbi:hypothetical protein ACFL2A_02625 [Thermodesulfobacteriota bacterium]
MKKNHLLHAVLVLSFISGLVSFYGCDSGDDLDDPIANITGTWDISKMITSTDCDDESVGDTSSQTVIATQETGSNDVLLSVSGRRVEAVLDGNVLTYTDSFIEEGGTTTEEVEFTIASDGTTTFGTITYDWKDNVTYAGDYSCSGVITATGEME